MDTPARGLCVLNPELATRSKTNHPLLCVSVGLAAIKTIHGEREQKQPRARWPLRAIKMLIMGWSASDLIWTSSRAPCRDMSEYGYVSVWPPTLKTELNTRRSETNPSLLCFLMGLVGVKIAHDETEEKEPHAQWPRTATIMLITGWSA